MRKFLGSFCMMLCISISSYGQNPQLKSGIVFKKLFLDYQSQNGGSISKFDDYRHGFEIGFQRMLTDKVALNIPLRYGVVDSHLDSINCLKKTIASIDAQFQYQFIEPGRKVIPYVLAGLGGVYEKEGEFNLQVPAGLGFYFRLAPNAFINIQSEFRYSFSDNRNNLQHGIGFTYLIGKVTEDEVKPKPEMAKPDSDNDGIPDELDLCPNAFGSKELNGCPDKDGDGVADYLDKCPEVKGLKEFGGCPDSDNDGISDNEDECPKVAGPASNKGCPVKIEEPIVLDSDGDGVEDSKDKCPKEKGSIASMGCPDADGDGIPDKEDKKTLEVAMQAVQFQTGSAVLKPESSIVLTQIADIMSRYPDFNMTISGHTDNTGSASANQTLSEKRAKSCFDFLIKKGVAAVRMSFAGYGESRPISTNDNEKGRTFNRRVEFNLIPRQ